MKDVTSQVDIDPGDVDGEGLPLLRCICGAEWSRWVGPILSIYPDRPTECDNCGRKFYFTVEVRVYEVAPLD